MTNAGLDRSRFDWYPTVTYNGVTFSAAKVLSSSGSPRPALPVPLNVFTVHYGGAGQWLDPGDTAAELAAIERNHAIPQRKPNEYNSASDSEAVTWEWAGRFHGAHSAGENGTAWGHLVVLGLEAPTEAQADKLIEGVRRARRQLVDAGRLAPGHTVAPHLNMPGAQTACPGPLWTNRAWWARIAAPLLDPIPPVPLPDPSPLPAPDGGEDMEYIMKPVFAGATADTPWLAVFGSGAVRRAVNADVTYAKKRNLPIIDQNSAEQHAYLVQKFGV
jgi:hypothetical protein